MDTILIEIEQKIKVLETELAALPRFRQWRELEAFKARHIQHIEEARKFLASEEPARAEASVSRPPVEPQKRHHRKRRMRRSRTSSTDLITARCRKLIEQYGRPMPFRLLYDELIAGGIEIGGEDPVANLSSKLSSASSKGQLYKVKGLGWWLPERKMELLEKREGLTNGVGRPS